MELFQVLHSIWNPSISLVLLIGLLPALQDVHDQRPNFFTFKIFKSFQEPYTWGCIKMYMLESSCAQVIGFKI